KEDKAEDKKEDETEDKEKSEDQTPKSGTLDLWQPEKIDKRTAIFVTVNGVPEPENMTPVKVELEPEVIMSQIPCKVKVRIRNTGPQKNTSVTLYVDEKKVAERAVIVDNASITEAVLLAPSLEPGAHTARIETPTDNLTIDNAFYFIIQVEENYPTLCIGSDEDTLFLMHAFKASVASKSKATMKVDTIYPQKIKDTDLLQYSCVFLCNVLPLRGQEIARLENYVSDGGLLAIFPGNKATLADYKTWKSLPGLPSSIKNFTLKERKKILNWDEPHHHLFRGLKLLPGVAPTITVQKMFTWDKLDDKTTSLISTGGEFPFLLERPYGKGSVLLFAVSADRAWSSFPITPFYLPIAHQVVQYGHSISDNEPFIWATRGLSLSDKLPEATKTTDLFYPDEKKVPTSTAMIKGKEILRAENLLQPGIYRLGIGGARPKPVLGVNITRKESDLTPIKKEEIIELINFNNVHVAKGRIELEKIIEDYRVGRNLSELILWLALILSVVEIFYANRRTKTAEKLSEELEIDDTGKVQGEFVPEAETEKDKE
ncbi:hypothetical protein ACFLS1_12375, partial [Verrucomicrobiota bacterium]